MTGVQTCALPISQQYGIELTEELSESMSQEEFYRRIGNLQKSVSSTVAIPENKVASLEQILEENIIVGEISHSDITGKRFLIDNMEAFKNAGYTTLYFEHLYYDQHQYLLDELQQSGKMHILLEQRLQLFDRYYGVGAASEQEWSEYNFSALVKAAQKYQIRIVALDIKAVYELQDSKTPGKGRDLEDRTIMGDYCFARIIQHDQERQERHQSNEKFIAFIGGGHIQGLKQLVHFPVMTILAGDGSNNDIRFSSNNRLLTRMELPDFELSEFRNLPQTDVLILSSQNQREIPAVTRSNYSNDMETKGL